MAYNVLKGKVEGSVDQYGNQEIDGIKVFKSTISASVFYDTDAQSPCATLKDVAVKNINGTTPNSILTFVEPGTLKANFDLTFDGKVLQSHHVKSKLFIGSGKSLKDLPGNKFYEKINAEHLNFGRGLHSVRDELQIKTHNGLMVDEDGVGVSLSSASGLSIKSKNLVIDITKVPNIDRDGQNISDQDLLLISDMSRGHTNNTTIRNFFDGYIKPRMHKPSGTQNELQFNHQKHFGSSANLTFDPNKNTFSVNGKVKADVISVDASLKCAGSVFHNIVKVTDNIHHVSDEDYTILCDASKNKIKIVLPPAINNEGRIIIIKKANSDKYKLNSNQIEVLCEEGRIDINDKITIKMNYSSRTLQSDGENWWIIGTKGS